MKRLLVLLVLLGACRSAPKTTPTAAMPAGGYGAEAPRAAVQQFLAAIKSGDLQAISMVWGNAGGPLVNDASITREELERRELLMVCFFKHDSAKVLEQVQAGVPDHTVFATELTRGDVTRRPTISTDAGSARSLVRGGRRRAGGARLLPARHQQASALSHRLASSLSAR